MIPAWVETPKGDIYLNQLKRYVKGGFLAPPSDLNPVTTPAAAVDPGISPVVTMQGPQDAVGELYAFTGRHTPTDAADVQSRLEVSIHDQRWLRHLMNRPVLANHVFGTGQYPNELYETLLLEGQQNLAFEFTNRSAAGASHFAFLAEQRKFVDVNVNEAFVTRFLRSERKRKALLYPFWLTSDRAINIPAGATREELFTITADVALVLFEGYCDFITTGVAGDVQEGLAFEFFNPKNGRPLQNSPIPLNCCFGQTALARLSHKLPCPLMVEPATTMMVRITNLITDQPTEAFITFHGVAYYQGNGPWQYSDQTETLGRGPYTAVPQGHPGPWDRNMKPQMPVWPVPHGKR